MAEQRPQPRPWSDIVQDERYLSLPEEKRQKVKQTFFNEIVAPSVDPGQWGNAWQEMDVAEQKSRPGALEIAADSALGVARGAPRLLSSALKTGGRMAQDAGELTGIDYWSRAGERYVEAGEHIGRGVEAMELESVRKDRMRPEITASDVGGVVGEAVGQLPAYMAPGAFLTKLSAAKQALGFAGVGGTIGGSFAADDAYEQGLRDAAERGLSDEDAESYARGRMYRAGAAGAGVSALAVGAGQPASAALGRATGRALGGNTSKTKALTSATAGAAPDTLFGGIDEAAQSAIQDVVSGRDIDVDRAKTAFKLGAIGEAPVGIYFGYQSPDAAAAVRDAGGRPIESLDINVADNGDANVNIDGADIPLKRRTFREKPTDEDGNELPDAKEVEVTKYVSPAGGEFDSINDFVAWWESPRVTDIERDIELRPPGSSVDDKQPGTAGAPSREAEPTDAQQTPTDGMPRAEPPEQTAEQAQQTPPAEPPVVEGEVLPREEQAAPPEPPAERGRVFEGQVIQDVEGVLRAPDGRALTAEEVQSVEPEQITPEGTPEAAEAQAAQPEKTPEEIEQDRQAEIRVKRSEAAKKRAAKALKTDHTKDDLVLFIRKKGGIDVDQESDVRGRLSHLNRGYGQQRIQKTVPGIERHGKGLTLDEAAELAAEAGYIENRDVNELIEKLYEAENNPIYSKFRADEDISAEVEEQMRAAYEDNGFAEDEFTQIGRDLQAEGLRPDDDVDRVDQDLVEQAAEIDEVAVEQLAKQYENDDDAFMAAIQEIIDGNRQPDEDAAPVRVRDEDQAPAGAESEGQGFQLEQQTEQSRQAEQQRVAEVERQEQQARREEETRAQAQAEADDFRLTGSDAEADQAAARGQRNLLEDQAPAEPARAADQGPYQPVPLPPRGKAKDRTYVARRDDDDSVVVEAYDGDALVGSSKLSPRELADRRKADEALIQKFGNKTQANKAYKAARDLTKSEPAGAPEPPVPEQPVDAPEQPPPAAEPPEPSAAAAEPTAPKPARPKAAKPAGTVAPPARGRSRQRTYEAEVVGGPPGSPAGASVKLDAFDGNKRVGSLTLKREHMVDGEALMETLTAAFGNKTQARKARQAIEALNAKAAGEAAKKKAPPKVETDAEKLNRYTEEIIEARGARDKGKAAIIQARKAAQLKLAREKEEGAPDEDQEVEAPDEVDDESYRLDLGAVNGLNARTGFNAKLVRDPGRAAKRMARLYQRRFGRRVVFIRGNAAPNGFYPGDDRLFINIDSTHGLRKTLGHEFLHSLSKKDPDLYRRVVDLIENRAADPAKKAASIEKVRQAYKDHGLQPPSEAKLTEEYIADVFGLVMADKSFMRRMERELEPSQFRVLMQRILDFIDDVVAMARKVPDKGALPPEVAAQLQSTLKNMEAAREIVAEALRQASPTRRGEGSVQPEVFEFGGTRAAEPPLNQLDRAKELVQEGADQKDIWQQTGWMKGPDGKWRFEIDDSKARLNPDVDLSRGGSFRLADVLEHTELYRQYPELTRLFVHSGTPESGAIASYSEGSNTITLSKDAGLSELLHEVQHAIQSIELFARGGSPSEFLSSAAQEAFARQRDIDAITEYVLPDFTDAFQNIVDDIGIEITVGPQHLKDFATGRLGDRLFEAMKGEADYDEIAAVVNDIEVELEGALSTYLDDILSLGNSVIHMEQVTHNAELAAETRYWNLAGEIEARDVQARADLTPEQRAQTPPELAEDDGSAEVLFDLGVDDGGKKGRKKKKPQMKDMRRKERPPGATPVEEEVAHRKMWNTFYEEVGDSTESIQRVQEYLEGLGAIIDDDNNVWREINLQKSQTSHRIEDVRRAYVKLAKQLKEDGISIADFDTFLYARHAEERNKAIDERRTDDRLTDRGSGMHTEAARAILASYSPEMRAKLEKHAAVVDQLNADNLKRALDEGLITQELYDSVSGAYEHYVPLMTLDVDPGLAPAVFAGSGTDARGSILKVAYGRASRADSPMTASFMLAANTHGRVSRAHIARALLKLAEQDTEEEIFSVLPGNSFAAEGHYFDPDADGQLRVADGRLMAVTSKDVFVAKVDGKNKYIAVKSPTVQMALRNISKRPESAGGELLELMGRGTRFYSSLLTRYNPKFVPIQFFRDTIAATIQGQAYGISPKELWAEQAASLKGIVQWMRDPDADSPEANMFRQFRDDGGMTSTLGLKDFDSFVHDLEKTGQRLRAEEGNDIEASVRYAANIAASPFKFVGALNDIAENLSRLSAYRVALNQGKSRKEAAFIAKEITVNFDRKGNAAVWLRPFIMFYNPAVQGFRAAGVAAKHPKVKASIMGLFAVGVLSELMNYILGGEDEESGRHNIDAQSNWTRDHNIVMALGGERVLKIPMPYVLNIPFLFGRRAVSAMFQPNADEAKDVLLGALVSAFDSASPVAAASGKDSFGEALLKTASGPLRPVIETLMNSNFMGSNIYPSDPFNQTPDRLNHYPNVSEASLLLTKAIAWPFVDERTGRAGVMDISPGSVDHIIDAYTAGPGDLVEAFVKLSMLDLEPHRIPILNAFYGKESKLPYSKDFYAATKAISDTDKWQEDSGGRLTAGERRAKAAIDRARRRISVLRDRAATAETDEERDEILRQMDIEQRRAIRVWDKRK